MGEQGAKSLRGGKMEDVIFAGTSGRAPLGRAEVVLTIDNSDGALPIDYSEVTISRTMFRNGGSEYAINSQHVRLLDVQELLSDSGIGREMHVIVGQGQLDSILQATPEGRRGFIEEAAGVLKHRKRKEKALRKLEACEGNLNRLSDLITEIRRQLQAARPAGRGGAEGCGHPGRGPRCPVPVAGRRPGPGDAGAGGRRRRRAGDAGPAVGAGDDAGPGSADRDRSRGDRTPGRAEADHGAGDLVFAGRAAGAGVDDHVDRPGADAQRRRRSRRAAHRP